MYWKGGQQLIGKIYLFVKHMPTALLVNIHPRNGGCYPQV